MSRRPAGLGAEYWEDRLYRNTFTYRGQRREVKGWCVKIQWRGVRRTLRLASDDRAAAAVEAAEIWADLCRGGWEAVSGRRRGFHWRREETSGPAEAPRVPRVGVRKYVSDLNPGFRRELFAELATPGGGVHFALGTEDENAGRVRAQELGAVLQREGMGRLMLSHAREATVAVFWQANPMTCTYTTLLSCPAAAGHDRPAPCGSGWRVLVVEPDGGVRRALERWLGGKAGLAQVAGVPEVPSPGAEAAWGKAWDLVLASREQPVAALRGVVGGSVESRARVLTHGVFTDSDAIFASFSGVSRGYALRRVAPGDLLAPVLDAFPEGPPAGAGEVDRQVRRYFQAMFEAPDGGDGGSGAPSAGLTARELEILDLLARGFADKEIAGELGISTWTVHSHLRRIFAKYGVRTRTEAVVRHLQK